MLAPWKESYNRPRYCIKKHKHHFANKGLYSQSYMMWELGHKESWMPKNCCFFFSFSFNWRLITLQYCGGFAIHSHQSMLLNCGAGEDTWESCGLQGDKTSQSERKSTLNIHWKDWCWSSNTLATWCKELTHWKTSWCWERLRQKEKKASEDEMVR